MHGNWNYDMHDGIGWGWIPMALMMLIVWGSLIWVVVALLRRSGNHEQTTVSGPSAASPQQILGERLARGEIEPDEYRTRLEVLTTTHS